MSVDRLCLLKADRESRRLRYDTALARNVQKIAMISCVTLR